MSEDERPTAPVRPASLDTGAWDIVAYLLSGMLVWGGAGWLLDWAHSAARGIVGQLEERSDTFRYGWTGKDFKAKGTAGKGLR